MRKLLYSEVQRPSQWIIWAFAAGVPLFAIKQVRQPKGSKSGLRDYLSAAAIAGIGVLYIKSRLITEVRSDGLYIRYVPFHLSFRKIPLDDVADIRPCTYNPLLEYGGWGIRFGRRGRAYNMAGNRGVRIEYKNGRHILIGSQKPEELAEAIESVRAKSDKWKVESDE